MEIGGLQTQIVFFFSEGGVDERVGRGGEEGRDVEDAEAKYLLCRLLFRNTTPQPLTAWNTAAALHSLYMASSTIPILAAQIACIFFFPSQQIAKLKWGWLEFENKLPSTVYGCVTMEHTHG